MDKEAILALSVQHLEKEKKDLAAKLAGVAKRIDHLERAFRKEEIPLLKQDYQRQQTRDREAFVSTQAARVTALRKQHSEDISIKGRLVHIMPDYRAFRTRIEADSRAAFDHESEVKAEQLQEAKEQRREEVKAQRAQEEAHRRQEEIEAEARRAQEEGASSFSSPFSLTKDGSLTLPHFCSTEAERQQAEIQAAEQREKEAVEERRRKMDEEAGAERAKRLAEREAERQADLDKIAKQRAREEEALARRQNGIRPPAAPIGPAAVGSAAWREQRAADAAAAAPAAGERPRIALAPRSALVPVAAAAAPVAAPIRPTPAAAPAPRGPPVVVPGGARPSWRDREAARAASGGAEGTFFLFPPFLVQD